MKPLPSTLGYYEVKLGRSVVIRYNLPIVFYLYIFLCTEGFLMYALVRGLRDATPNIWL